VGISTSSDQVPIAAPLIAVVAERSSVSAAFFVWGVGGLAAPALLIGDRLRLDRGRSTLARNRWWSGRAARPTF
jgi:hypothetical protein